MSLLTLQPDTLKLLKKLVQNPAAALPTALELLDPEGPWELLTQRVRSEQVKIQASKAELSLPLLDKKASDSGALSSKWAWSASVDANARLTMDLLADEDLAALGIQPDAGQTLVAYGASLAFSGNLGAKTSAVAWGSVGVSAGGKHSGAARWFVQAKDDGTLLDALESAQRHFVSPHDLQAMLRLANRTDWFGLEMALHGEAQLALDVEAKAAGTGWTFSIDGDKTSVGLSVGLDASLSVLRRSDWLLRVTVVPLAGDSSGRLGLRVALHDQRQSEKAAALSFSAGADFGAVAASAERLLRAAWPALDNDLLDALARPGTALGGQLTALIDSKLDGPLNELVTLLTGGNAPAKLRNTLVDKLTGGLSDVLDGALGDISAGKASVNQTLNAWLQRLLGKAAGSIEADDQLKAVVVQALDQATRGLEGAIVSLQNNIVGKAQDKVDAVLKTLGELGAQFDGKLDRVDENAASKAIRAAIERYADLRSKLLQRLTEAGKQKVMLTLSGEWKRDIADEAVFEAVFVPPGPGGAMAPEAEQLYHAICGGRMLALPQMLAAALEAGAVTAAKGWLLSTAKTLATQRAVLNFFGIQISSSTSWLREVGVKTDLVTGNLLVARGSLDVETAIANPWMNRKANLGVLFELSGDVGPAVMTASLNGAFSAMKGDFANRDKVQDLLDAYADATGNRRTDVRIVLDVPSGSAEKAFWRDLTLSIPVNLDSEQWRNFADKGGNEIDQVALEVALRQFEERYRKDSLFSKDPVADLQSYAAAYFEREGETNAGVLAYLKRFPQRYVGRHSAGGEALKMEIPVKDSTNPLDKGSRIFQALHRLSAIVQAPGRLQVLARQAAERVRNAPTPVDPMALRQGLDDILKRTQQALSPVALVSETWLGIGLGGANDEPVSWPFASFITTMARLSGMPVPPGFVPVAQSGTGLSLKLLPAT